MRRKRSHCLPTDTIRQSAGFKLRLLPFVTNVYFPDQLVCATIRSLKFQFFIKDFYHE